MRGEAQAGYSREVSVQEIGDQVARLDGLATFDDVIDTDGNNAIIQGLAYLMKELLGLTDDRAGFIYVSDVGHFEDLFILTLSSTGQNEGSAGRCCGPTRMELDDPDHSISVATLDTGIDYTTFKNSAQQSLAGLPGNRGYRTVLSRSLAPLHTLRY